MAAEVVIDSRFRGPPDSANGGYACGVLAAHLDDAPGGPGDAAGAAAARSPPRGRRKRGRRAASGWGHAGGRGDGRPRFRASRSPSRSGSRRRRRRGRPRRCSRTTPTRSASSAAATAPAATASASPAGRCPAGRASWSPRPSRRTSRMAAPDGSVRDEFVWSVLDCPGGIAGMLVPDLGDLGPRPADGRDQRSRWRPAATTWRWAGRRAGTGASATRRRRSSTSRAARWRAPTPPGSR